MDCEHCLGCCCRYIKLPIGNITKDTKQWLNYHENIVVQDDHITIQSICKHLTNTGKCAIYKHRPLICQQFRTGGQECLNARKQYNVR